MALFLTITHVHVIRIHINWNYRSQAVDYYYAVFYLFCFFQFPTEKRHFTFHTPNLHAKNRTQQPSNHARTNLCELYLAWNRYLDTFKSNIFTLTRTEHIAGKITINWCIWSVSTPNISCGRRAEKKERKKISFVERHNAHEKKTVDDKFYCRRAYKLLIYAVFLSFGVEQQRTKNFFFLSFISLHSRPEEEDYSSIVNSFFRVA